MALRGGPFTGGGSLQQMISLVDLPPTLLDVAGVPIPPAWQGRSILPLVNREKVDWPEEAFVQISESQVGRAVRTKRWKYSVSAPDKNAVTDMGSAVYREEFLYDLYADPYELNNLIGLASHRAVADRMRDRLLARMAQAGEPPATIQPAESRPGGQKHVSAAEVEL
jgi:arylsulfatase A-like enzyme